MPNWTDAQKEAIGCEAETILVSAAAGSGKSTVLTERILTRLTREDDPVDLDQMLIVTFTRAAAAELKEKLSSALTDALARNPRSSRLAKQMLALNRAKISTIHSFCFDLLRSHAQEAGLSPSVRIAEESEGRLLRREVMESVIGDCFDQPDPASDFPMLYDYFVSGKNDSAEDGFLALYDSLLQYPEGLDRLLLNAAQYDRAAKEDFLGTVWGREAAKELTRTFSYFRSLYRRALSALSGEEGYEKTCALFAEEADFLDTFLSLLQGGRSDALSSVLASFSFERLPKAPASQDYEAAKAVRESLKKEIAGLKKNPLFLPASETEDAAVQSAAFLRALHAFLTRFDARLTEEKQRRNLVDFTDLERCALRLLVRDGQPTETAEEVSAGLKEIYIDEYQDVNELQDAIFRAAAVHSKRFMVGDSKQSIYGFRGAVPELFAAYRRDPEVKTVFLQENFRSSPNLLAFDNAVCGYLFRRDSGRMPYEDRDDLVPGLAAGTSVPVEVALIDGDTDEEGNEVADEAEYVASRISALLGEGTAPGEITILLRSPGSCAAEYEQALGKRGIPYANQEKRDLFENPQVLLYLCLLNCIDNPRRDTFLAGLLRSPLCGFSLDDLVKIRAYSDGTLYDALRAYAAETGEKRAVRFLEKLSQYRLWAYASPVDRLVWRLYEDTDAFSLTVGDGTDPMTNRAKLLRLYEYARQSEKGSFRGLNRFLRWLNDILESGEKMPEEDGSAGENAVRILSIHSSKGLQFDTCFLCGCGRQFNREDEKRNLLTERTLGIALRLNDESGFARLATPFHSAARLRLKENQLDEEMRLLYVALTRAKRRLIVTGRTKKPDELLASCASADGGEGDAYLVSHASCYLTWILTALRASGFSSHTETVIRSHADPAPQGQTRRAGGEGAEETADASLLSLLRARFAFSYPDPALSSLPSKLTVSRLTPSLLDENEDGVLDLSRRRESEFASPAFLSPQEQTGAQRGTATHLFMQFCDFDRVREAGIGEEIDRLVREGFLPGETAPLILRGALAGFFSSPLCRAMTEAQTLRREVRFNVNLPAYEFSRTGNFPGEEVLVQGVIDCYFIDRAGSVTLVDYKTDAIPQELRGNREAEEEFLLSRHRDQLHYYRLALEKILCRRVRRVLLWSFSLNRAIAVE